MARNIYAIKLKNSFIPAASAEDALDQYNTLADTELTPSEASVEIVVKEEHVMKMFILAKTMFDAEKFEYDEMQAAISALALKFGYYSAHEDITDCVLTWVERFADITPADLEEWVIN